MWDYKALPLAGHQEINNHQLGASYSYDPYVPHAHPHQRDVYREPQFWLP